jgi:glucuronoarabinoxylan endo-1,4-beta-xylanase
MTTEEINTAFGTGDGQLGFSILRLRVPNQKSEFSLNVPTAQMAHTLGVTLIASPWSPPPEMKSNNNIVGGELEEAYYNNFAAHLKSFADYMAENDASIYAISVQNEPDVHVGYESCDWNASQMLKFIKENAPSIEVKVMTPESADFDKQLSDPILNDSSACANLDIVAGHIYGGGLEPYPLAESKGKEMWMTEHLQLGTSWVDALSTANDMNDCMRAGMNAYIWWYIVRFYGPIGDGEIDYAKGEVTKRGYAMSQFARFIRPGYLRVDCTGNPQGNIFASAYKDSTSSKVVIVAINNSSQTVEQTFTLKNGTVEKFTPYVTSETKDCGHEEDISVSDGSFSANLEGSSITTLVSGSNTVTVENSASILKSFKLYQNYPNPFNPCTNISFTLPQKTFVSLKIFDHLGREVALLVSGELSAGNYSQQWNAGNISSGVYFYRLSTIAGFVETKKLLLLT